MATIKVDGELLVIAPKVKVPQRLPPRYIYRMLDETLNDMHDENIGYIGKRPYVIDINCSDLYNIGEHEEKWAGRVYKQMISDLTPRKKRVKSRP